MKYDPQYQAISYYNYYLLNLTKADEHDEEIYNSLEVFHKNKTQSDQIYIRFSLYFLTL